MHPEYDHLMESAARSIHDEELLVMREQTMSRHEAITKHFADIDTGTHTDACPAEAEADAYRLTR